jgi:cytoskeletal protein CcmA (bactofilin family)
MLFTRKIDDSATVEPVQRPAATTWASPMPATPARSMIESWLRVTGNLDGEGELEIEGHVVGNVRCTQLVVGSKASIEGDIRAEQVIVRGKVAGTIRANSVILQSTARVDGEIFHRELAMEAGAEFEGASRHREDPVGDLKAMAAQMKAAVGSAPKAKAPARPVQRPEPAPLPMAEIMPEPLPAAGVEASPMPSMATQAVAEMPAPAAAEVRAESAPVGAPPAPAAKARASRPARQITAEIEKLKTATR